jgi:hypothetical protein
MICAVCCWLLCIDTVLSRKQVAVLMYSRTNRALIHNLKHLPLYICWRCCCCCCTYYRTCSDLLIVTNGHNYTTTARLLLRQQATAFEQAITATATTATWWLLTTTTKTALWSALMWSLLPASSNIGAIYEAPQDITPRDCDDQYQAITYEARQLSRTNEDNFRWTMTPQFRCVTFGSYCLIGSGPMLDYQLTVGH